jgi:hypothetical protein
VSRTSCTSAESSALAVISSMERRRRYARSASCCPKRARGPPIGIAAALTRVPTAGESPFGIGRCHRIRSGGHPKRRRSASLEAVRSFITLAT